MGDLSANFDRSEFRCPHCGEARVDPLLVAALQRLRTRKRRALRIVSGYRCPVFNERVGGVRYSLHLTGQAADVPGGYATVEDCRAAGFTGVGLRRGRVVHVDVETGRRFHTFQDPAR